MSSRLISNLPRRRPAARRLQRYGALDWYKVVHGNQAWRLESCTWLHAGLIHLLANMISLIFIGVRLEQQFGFCKPPKHLTPRPRSVLPRTDRLLRCAAACNAHGRGFLTGISPLVLLQGRWAWCTSSLASEGACSPSSSSGRASPWAPPARSSASWERCCRSSSPTGPSTPTE